MPTTICTMDDWIVDVVYVDFRKVRHEKRIATSPTQTEREALAAVARSLAERTEPKGTIEYLISPMVVPNILSMKATRRSLHSAWRRSGEKHPDIVGRLVDKFAGVNA